MAQMTTAYLITLALFSNLVQISHANEFLKDPKVATERVSEEDIRVTLLDEVEASLGKGSATNRLSQIEDSLRPIVAALPRNARGHLERSAVSYALHRLFVLRHGWVIKGLDASAGPNNSASPTGVLTDQVPAYIEGLFEGRLADKGLEVRELAVLAATIEHLIHNEAVSRLGAAFNTLKLSLISPISMDAASEVLDAYMMGYILGENLNNLTDTQVRHFIKTMPALFLAWHDTQQFVDGVRKKVLGNNYEGEVGFANLAKVVEAIGEEYGTFQDLECQQMKDTMVAMEYRGTGRVTLADFYKPALNGVWTFQESPEYLRSLGALDESVPNHPSVLMVNYITSSSNCIASSGFYKVCCKDECSGLLAHLEERIGTPEASPGIITALIENLPSKTVSVPHKLSTSMLKRLEDIATSHKGMVPLHSRLFAQWMHHVYPRECPFPHMSGTVSAKTPDEWIADNGSDGTATEEEMRQHVAHAPKVTLAHRDLAVEDITPWSEADELLVDKPIDDEEALRPTASMSAAMRSLVLIAASASLSYGLIQTMGATSVCETPKYKV